MAWQLQQAIKPPALAATGFDVGGGLVAAMP